MRRKFYRKLKLYLQSAVPGFIAVFLILAASAKFPIAGISEFMPFFATATIFFWTIYAPLFVPIWLCLGLGLLQDALNGMVLGISSLIYVILWGSIYSQRRFLIKENFMVIYGIFIMASLVTSILYWLLFSLMIGKVFFTPSILIQWFFTVTLYPIIHLLFGNIYLMMVKSYRYSNSS